MVTVWLYAGVIRFDTGKDTDMCGRYYIEIDEEELKEICDAVERKNEDEPEQIEIKLSGEIFPTDVVPVQTESGYEAMKWGFSGFNSRPIINARSETALIKPTFKESMASRRCLIPASGYYEWQHEGKARIKHRFYLPQKPLFLAGCFRREKDMPTGSFVILTREASEDIRYIHDRMPVIIPKDRAGEWLSENPGVMDASITELEYDIV